MWPLLLVCHESPRCLHGACAATLTRPAALAHSNSDGSFAFVVPEDVNRKGVDGASEHGGSKDGRAEHGGYVQLKHLEKMRFEPRGR